MPGRHESAWPRFPFCMSSLSTTPAADTQRMPIWALLTALIMTGAVTHTVWYFTSSRDDADARVGFEIRASQIDIAVRERMREYEQALLGMSTIFASGVSLDRARWIAQFELLRLAENHPGLENIGYAPRITPEEKPHHEAALRKHEHPDYAILPDGARPIYTPVAYLAPTHAQQRTMIGLDLYHEASLRAAMDAASDTGRAVISRKALVSQNQKDGWQTGFLMVLPVYRRDAAITTAAQRREAIQGFVFCTFRAHEFAATLLASKRDVRVEIFDGTGQHADALVVDSSAKNAPTASQAPRFFMLSTIPLHGGTWSLRVSTLPEFESAINHDSARIATAGAMLICLLALTILWSQLTLRRRAEVIAEQMTRDLTQSREQLELALEGSDLALFDCNISTGELQLSSRWSLMLGGKPEPVRTTLKALEALVPPEDQGVISTQIRELLAGRTDRYQVEHRVRRHDGTLIWIASHAKVVERDSMNRALRLVGTNLDISRRKEMDRMKNEFISTVSHELRTPVTAMMGALGLLRSGAVGPIPGKAATFVDMACQNGEKLSALVNDILALENLNAGRMTLQIKAVPLASFLQRAISASAGLAQKKNMRLTLAPVPESLSVHADAERLLQVVTNLLSNAVKFSPAGEKITVTAEARGAVARVSVIDNGSGIPPEFRQRLFERFAQADGSSTRAQDGTGLGLAVCKSLIEGMGGQIGYASEAGKNTPGTTTFYFDLPVAGDAQQPAAPKSA